MSDIVGMILAGGQGSRLSILSKKRAKPAVPFGGIYRIIDFTLSNAMVSGIRYVGILTQYNPFSLTDHIRGGEFWGFTGFRARMTIVMGLRAKMVLKTGFARLLAKLK